ncbi:MAG: glucosaminidase domain-containing protein [Romboutsia sp.]
MNLCKKIIVLVCLSSMLLGFNLSSKKEIPNNLDLNKIDEINKQDIISKDKVKNEQSQVVVELKAEKQRILKVAYCREDITVVTGINKEEMKQVLLSTKGAKTMVHLADAFVEAEKKYGINAFFMAGVVALESGFATSRRAVEDNNLTGYEVYKDNSEGKLFSTQIESILQTAKHLRKNYLTEGGVYYNGLSVDAIQIQYCPDEGLNKNWNGKVNELANSFFNTYNDLFKNNIEISQKN